MEYRVLQTFRDRAQGFKLVKAHTLYPPPGAEISNEWLAYLVDYRDAEGNPVLEPLTLPRKGRAKKTLEDGAKA